MIKYEKPILNIVELQVKETVTALVPDSVSDSQSDGYSDSGLITDNEIGLLEAYNPSNTNT